MSSYTAFCTPSNGAKLYPTGSFFYELESSNQQISFKKRPSQTSIILGFFAKDMALWHDRSNLSAYRTACLYALSYCKPGVRSPSLIYRASLGKYDGEGGLKFDVLPLYLSELVIFTRMGFSVSDLGVKQGRFFSAVKVYSTFTLRITYLPTGCGTFSLTGITIIGDLFDISSADSHNADLIIKLLYTRYRYLHLEAAYGVEADVKCLGQYWDDNKEEKHPIFDNATQLSRFTARNTCALCTKEDIDDFYSSLNLNMGANPHEIIEDLLDTGNVKFEETVVGHVNNVNIVNVNLINKKADNFEQHKKEIDYTDSSENVNTVTNNEETDNFEQSKNKNEKYEMVDNFEQPKKHKNQFVEIFNDICVVRDMVNFEPKHIGAIPWVLPRDSSTASLYLSRMAEKLRLDSVKESLNLKVLYGENDDPHKRNMIRRHLLEKSMKHHLYHDFTKNLDFTQVILEKMLVEEVTPSTYFYQLLHSIPNEWQEGFHVQSFGEAAETVVAHYEILEHIDNHLLFGEGVDLAVNELILSERQILVNYLQTQNLPTVAMNIRARQALSLIRLLVHPEIYIALRNPATSAAAWVTAMETALESGFNDEFQTQSLGTNVLTLLNDLWKTTVGIALFSMILHAFYLNAIQPTVNKISGVAERVENQLTTVSGEVSGIALKGKASIENLDAVISYWKNFSFGFTNIVLSAEQKLMMLEIKSLLHCFYHMYNKNLWGVAEHASNFIVTRPEIIQKLALSLGRMGIDIGDTVNKTIFNYKGKNYETTPEGFNTICESYESGCNVQSTIDDTCTETFETQSLDTVKDLFGGLSFLCSTGSAFNLTPNELKEANLQMSFISHKARVFETGYSTAMKVISALSRVLFAFDPLDADFQTLSCEMMRIIDFTNKAVLWQDELGDRLNIKELTEFHAAACLVNDNPRLQSVPTAYRNIYMQRWKDLEALTKKTVGTLTGKMKRVEPCFLLMCGPAGVGKSGSLDFVMKSLCRRYHGDEFDEMMAYHFGANLDYWEKYAKNRFVLMDDLMRCMDIKTRAAEAATVISMQNTVPFQLNMAFEEKGAAFFDSPWILATTNLADKGYDSETFDIGLTQKEAFKRRMTLVLYRDEKCAPDAADNLYRIEQCTVFPELKGSYVRTVEVVDIMMEIKKKQIADFKTYEYTAEDLDQRYDKRQQQMAVHGLHWADLVGTKKEVEKLFSEVIDTGPLSRLHRPIEEKLLTMPVGEEHVDTDVPQLTIIEETKDNFTTQSGTNDKVVKPTLTLEEFIHLFVKNIGSTIWPGEWNDYMIPLFFTLATASTAGAIAFNWFGGPDAQSDNYKFDNNRTKRHHAMHMEALARGSSGIQVLNPKKKKKDGTTDGGNLTVQSNSGNFYNSLRGTIAKGIFYVSAVAYEGEKVVASESFEAFHLHDRQLVCPAHGMMPLQKYDDVVLHIQGYNMEPFAVKRPDDTIRMTNGDTYILQLPVEIQTPKAMYNYIPSAADIKDIQPGTPLKLVLINKEGELVLKSLMMGESPGSFGYNACNERFYLEKSINYYEPKTAPGDSGGLIVVEGHQGQVRVVGIHCGIKNGLVAKTGVAQVLTKEYFKTSDQFFETQSTSWEECIPFEILREIEDGKVHIPPRDSKIKQSPMFGWSGDPVKIPVFLKSFINENGDTVNPLLNGLKKYHQTKFEGPPIPDEVLEVIKSLYPRDGTARILTFEECVKGVDDDEITSINFSTSAGYPWKTMSGSGKSMCLEKDGDSYKMKPEFQSHMEQFDQDVRNSQWREVLFALALKEEVRLREKVFAGKTRVFLAAPFDYNLLCKRYFGACMSYVKKLSGSKPITIGLNAHSMEWGRLYDRMIKNGSVVAADATNWDGNMYGAAAFVFLRWVNWWYNDEFSAVREWLLRQSTEAKHLLYKYIYQVLRGMASGSLLTGFINSGTNLVKCITVLMFDLHLKKEEFEIAVNGDDNLISIHKKGIRVSTLAPFFKSRYDLDITHWSKDNIDRDDTLETIDFNGRGFLNTGGYIRAPLKLTTICESIMWVKSSEPVDRVMISTIETMYIELAHHSEETFDLYTSKLLDAVLVRMPHLYNLAKSLNKGYWFYTKRMFAEGGTLEIPCRSTMLMTDYRFETQSMKMRNTEGVKGKVRSASSLIPTRSVPLGAFDEVSDVSDTSVNNTSLQEPHVKTNMETFRLNGVLDREYQVAKIDWSSSLTEGHVLSNLQFPYLLFNIPFLSQKLNDARFFKAGIKVTFHMASSNWLYGTLLCEVVPYLYNQINPVTTLLNRSGSPHVLLSAAQGGTVSIDIPFISPFRALDLVDHYNEEMAMVNVVILNPLINISGEVSEAEILVTAQFIDAQVFLPHYAPPPEVATTSGLGVFKTKVLNSGKINHDEDFVIQSNHEAVAKSEMGIISNVLESSIAIAGTLKDIPLVSEYADIYTMSAKPLAQLAKISGLCKPTTLNATQIIKNNTNFDLNYGRGIDTAPKLAMDPENGISTVPNVGGISTDEMELSYILQTPFMIRNLTIERDDTQPLVISSTNLDRRSYVKLISDMFMYRSGSLKIKVYIRAAQGMNVTGVFYFSDSEADDAWMYCYHTQVAITGDAEFDVTIPYAEQRVATQASPLPLFKLFFKQLTWSQPNDDKAIPIYMNVYQAAASDYRVYVLQDFCFVPESNPRKDFVDDFPPIHPSITGYLVENMICGEEYTTLRQIAKRYWPVGARSSGSTTAIWNSADTGTIDGWMALKHLFRFRRGSLRERWILRGTQQNATVRCVSNFGARIAGVMIANSALPQIDVEYPYYTHYMFEECNQPPHDPYNSIFDAGTGIQAYRFSSAGDDFSFHWLKAPPPGDYKVVDGRGSAAFTTWRQAAV